MNQMEQWAEVFVTSTRGALELILVFVPKLLISAILLVIALIVAKIVQKGFNKLFTFLGVDRISAKSGIEGFLSSAGFTHTLSWIFARILYWTVLLIFFLPIADVLGLVFFADIVNQVIAFLPNIFVAMLIILVGSWAARVLGGMVRGALSRIGFEYSEVLATVVKMAVLVISFIIALFQLHIEAGILSSILLIVVASFSLAFAIAFGLGAKDVVRNIVAGAYLARSVNTGSAVNVGGVEGTVVETGPLSTIINVGGDRTVTVPNTRFLQGE